MKSSSFVKQNALGFLVQFTGIFANFIFNIIFPIILGAIAFGRVSVTLGLSYLLVGFIDTGFNNACMRAVSKHYAEKQYGKVAYSFNRLLQLKLAISFAFALILVILRDVIANVYTVSPVAVVIAGILIIFYAMASFLSSFFVAINKNNISLRGAFINAFFLIMLPVVFYFMGFRLTGIVAAVALAFIISSLYMLVLTRAEIKKMKTKEKEVPIAQMFSSVLGFSIIALSTVFIYYGTLLILGLFVESDKVAFFKVTMGWLSAVVALIPISSSVVFSSFTSINAKNPSLMNKYLHKTMRFGLMIIVPAMIGLFILGPKMMHVIYGPSYDEAGTIITIMCWAILPLFMNGILLSALVACERLRKIATLYSASFVAGIAASFILSYLYGLQGAAYSFLFVNYAIFIMSYLMLGNKIRIQLADVVKPLIAAAVMAVVVYCLLGFASSLAMGIAVVFSGVVSYFAVLWIVKGIKKEDLSLLRLIKS